MEYIKNIKKKENAEKEIQSYFIIRNISLKRKKDGDEYLEFILGDSTGELRSFMWEVSKDAKRMVKGDKVKALGILKYSDKYGYSFYIKKIRLLKGKELQEKSFLPQSDKNISEMWKELSKILNSVQNVHLRSLISYFIGNNDWVENFIRQPASKKWHHSYVGGLLEHTLYVVKLAKSVSEIYNFLNRDLLIVGAFLHDIGKMNELNIDDVIDYTDSGQLLGHITQGIILIDEATKNIHNFPNKLKSVLQHIILSHHGSQENGSPKVPAILEAIVIHFLDEIDASVIGIKDYIDNDSNEKSLWTDFLVLKGTYFYKFDLDNMDD